MNINQLLRKDKRPCKYGAPMGDSNIFESKTALYLQRVTFTDGDYGPDNTYWGNGTPLWCAFNGGDEEFAPAMGTRIYVRAKNRAEAMRKVLADYPEAKFRRTV